MDNPPPPSSLSPVPASPAGGTQRGTLLPCKGFRIVHILLDQEPSLERKPWSGYMWIWYQRTWIGILISPLSSCGILKSIFLCSYLFNGANNPCILIHVDITQDNVWKGEPRFLPQRVTAYGRFFPSYLPNNKGFCRKGQDNVCFYSRPL